MFLTSAHLLTLLFIYNDSGYCYTHTKSIHCYASIIALIHYIIVGKVVHGRHRLPVPGQHAAAGALGRGRNGR